MALEKFFRWLCRNNLFHDFEENEKGEERCTFCNIEKRYGTKSGYFSGPI
jgi:hypothetical protein